MTAIAMRGETLDWFQNRGGLLRRHAHPAALHFLKGAPVFDRHDLAEFRAVVGPVIEDLLGSRRARIVEVVRNQLEETLLIVARHVIGGVDTSLVHAVAAVMMQLLQQFVLFGNRLQLDHGHVAAPGEITRLVEHIGHAARHAGREIASGFAEHDDDAAGHVFAAVIAHAFDDRGSSTRLQSRRRARCCRR